MGYTSELLFWHLQINLKNKYWLVAFSLKNIEKHHTYIIKILIWSHSFLQDWNFPFTEGTPSFWSKFKKLPLLSESHPNWCMEIVWNTLKRTCYVSYYTKSIENIINITLFTFRLNSVFYYVQFLWLHIAFNVLHTWCARGMNMKHF